ncbi:MAG: cytochrome b [Pseudomonadota bacterium]
MSDISVTVHGYPTISRWLHWITAVVVLLTIPVGVIMTTEGLSRPVQNSLFIYHKNVGVVIILLVLARLLVRAVTVSGPLPAAMPTWQRQAAAVSHGALYVLLLVMGISGYIRVTAGGFPIEMLNALNVPPLVPRSDALADTAKWVHATVRFAIAAFILLHIGAALQHGLIKRDGVFSRMWPLTAGRR